MILLFIIDVYDKIKTNEIPDGGRQRHSHRARLLRRRDCSIRNLTQDQNSVRAERERRQDRSGRSSVRV